MIKIDVETAAVEQTLADMAALSSPLGASASGYPRVLGSGDATTPLLLARRL